METPKLNYVITIGRQYGSGGREIGRLVADALGIKYYDKELLMESSKASGVKPEVFEATDERTPSFFSNIWSFNLGFNAGSYLLGSSPISDEKIYAAQSNVMKTLARNSSCLIVGLSADYVLRNHPGLISIFIHSSIEDRILRIMNRRGINSAEKAREIAEKKDKLRASYYNFYTDKVWGDAAGYDLSIDSSKLPADAVADFIVSYVKARLAQM